jgi:nitronate monooxygenase
MGQWADTRVARLLGLGYPIVQGPFGGGTSSVELAATVSAYGALGSFGANHLGPAEIASVVAAIRDRTDKPFNVNVWVPLPGERGLRLSEAELPASTARLRPYLLAAGVAAPDSPPGPWPDFDEQLAALIETAPPVVSFVFGVPPASFVEQARGAGMRVLGTATTVDEAIALERGGVDAIVASGSDAGGHRGAFLRPVEESLVGTLSLVPQVVDAVSLPVVAAGGIADARQVRAAFALGADGVQIGTAFLVTTESGASTVHKGVLTGPQGTATVLTSVFTGRLARAVPNRMTRELAGEAAALPPYPLQAGLTAPIRKAGAAAGDADLVNLWSGQSAGLTRPQSARDYLDGLVTALGS